MALGDRYLIKLTIAAGGKCTTLRDRVRETTLCTDADPWMSAALAYLAEFADRWEPLASDAATLVGVSGQRVHPTKSFAQYRPYGSAGDLTSPPLPGQAPLLLTRWTDGAPLTGRSTLYVHGIAQEMAWGGKLTDAAQLLADNLAVMALTELSATIGRTGAFLASHTYVGGESEFADYVGAWAPPQLGTQDKRIVGKCAPNDG